jgi:hypothetical protein
MGRMDLRQGVRKYINYVFDKKSFDANNTPVTVTGHALEVAKSIRGNSREPAIMIHGIMKRSGTVYVGHLLSIHPKLREYPNAIWEFPFLPLAGDIRAMQNDFFLAYGPNTGKIGEDDFLPLFGAAFLHYLHSFLPDGHRMLLKMPGVQYLNHFYDVFPEENLLVLTRDGRDLVTSTIKKWPQITFWDACRRWDRSAKMILACDQQFSGRDGYWMTKYEDAVRDPALFMREACELFNLEVDAYPFDQIDDLPAMGSSFHGLTRYPKNFKPIGRWHDWSAWKKSVYKSIAGKSLIALGYCDDLKW